MHREPLDRVFKPGSIAFYGASNNPLKMGTGQLATLLMQGFEGPIYPVHPTETEVLGLPAYRSIDEVPETPDLVVMVLPTRIVPGLLDDCGKAGVKAAVVVSGGFREVGGAGVELERELVDVARRHEMALIGPNCIGVANFHCGLNITYFPYEQEPGPVTMISQSGTYSCHIYGYTEKMGFGLSHTVSVGNSAVNDMSDCLEYFADEPTTRSIALYIEGIGDGDRFMRAARYAVSKKPVVALYVGGTGAGARAGMSHTGSPVPSGNRVCVLTNSGGPGASMSDSCSRAGLEVPLLSERLQKEIREILPATATVKNPVDITFHMDFRDIYETIPRLLFQSGEIDGMVMYGVFGSRLYRSIEDRLGDRVNFKIDEVFPVVLELISGFKDMPREYGKPIIVASFWGKKDDDALEFLTDNGLPVLPSPERAVGAIAALYHRHQVLNSP
jgi:acetyltransferase